MVDLNFINNMPPNDRVVLVQQLRGLSSISAQLAIDIETGQTLPAVMGITGLMMSIAFCAEAIKKVADSLNLEPVTPKVKPAPAVDDPEWQLNTDATL